MGHPWRLGGFVRLVLGAWLFAARSALEGPPFFGAQSISGFGAWAKAAARLGRRSGWRLGGKRNYDDDAGDRLLLAADRGGAI